MRVQLSMAEVDEKYAANEVEFLTAKIQIKHRAEKSVTAMKALFADDDECMAAKKAHHECYAYRKLVGALYVNVDEDTFLLSRELTRRIGRHDRERRNERYGD